MTPRDETRYLNLLLDPLDECIGYTPKFGSEGDEGVTLPQFRTLYGSDPFYHWMGLDSDLMYAAHKAAGGMTSVYRQLGNGCERLFRAIIQDIYNLSDEQVAWSYEIQRANHSRRTVTLDARLDTTHLTGSPEMQSRIRDWLGRCGVALELPPRRASQLTGAVFEARQGYKSADSKRQNADLEFGNNAAAANYLPVLAVISTQASQTVLRRYRNARMLVLTGVRSDDDTASTYAFFANVVRFDLAGLFERNSASMVARCQRVLQAILRP